MTKPSQIPVMNESSINGRTRNPLHGHPGIRKTIKLIQRRYFWPKLRRFVTAYVRSCDECSRNKSTHHKPYGLTKFLPIPDRPWSSISMDFIEQLPTSEGYD